MKVQNKKQYEKDRPTHQMGRGMPALHHRRHIPSAHDENGDCEQPSPPSLHARYGIYNETNRGGGGRRRRMIGPGREGQGWNGRLGGMGGKYVHATIWLSLPLQPPLHISATTSHLKSIRPIRTRRKGGRHGRQEGRGSPKKASIWETEFFISIHKEGGKAYLVWFGRGLNPIPFFVFIVT